MITRAQPAPLILLALLALLALAACTAEEPPPPEFVDPTGFATYAHPSGAFSLELPPDWIVSDTSDAGMLNVGFSPPGSPEPLLGVTVLSAGAFGGETDLEAMVERYQAAFYSSQAGAQYQEVGREPQPDGSVRIEYLLSTAGGTTQNNDFMQVIGPYFVALHARLPDDSRTLATLGKVINTLSVNTQAGWAGAGSGEQAAESAIGFAHLNHWLDSSGGVVLVGQVKNNSSEPLEFVRVNAQLFDGEGNLLVEQDNFVSSERIAPGEYAPFSLVFADGLPEGTVRYDLTASARYADRMTGSFYADFEHTGQAEFDGSGILIVSGQVRNRGGQTANLVKVIVTVFDDEHRVVGTDTTLVDVQQLGPGETSPYTVRFFELGGPPETFLVNVQGVIAD